MRPYRREITLITNDAWNIMSAFSEEDRLLLQDSVEKFIDENYPFDEKEARIEKYGKFGGFWPQYAELGWLMLPIGEEAGGLGGNVLEAQVLMRAFGRGLIAEPFVEVSYAAKVLELCLGEDAQPHLEPVLGGEEKLILAHCEDLPDPRFEGISSTLEKTSDGYLLNGEKNVVFQASCADNFLVTAYCNGKPALVKVPADTPGVEIREFSTIDSRYAADIRFSDVALSDDALLACADDVEIKVKRAILFGVAAMIAELEGIVVATRKLTAEYLNTRVQFGVKIGTFQALQHKLADIVIAEEEIRSLAWTVSNIRQLDDLDERERNIRMAKARACQAAIKAGELAVQLHGGIGVTDEMVIGHYLRRIIVIDSQFGDTNHQLLWLARHMQTGGGNS
jgi:alkylation response protein AidB-like acyl-CoA dehydrogenase